LEKEETVWRTRIPFATKRDRKAGREEGEGRRREEGGGNVLVFIFPAESKGAEKKEENEIAAAFRSSYSTWIG